MDLRREVEALKTRRRNVRFKEMDRLLLAAGFTRTQGAGDHVKYRHPRLRYQLVLDARRTLLPVYVTNSIRALEEVLKNEQ
ncbi:MAG: type II toxin-antitoxin system HicA family toxin [Dehalococcoidia bacterium]|nr:type II toxin-antitoxin system HicA family toxin [Dehalococcoidia bacterium]